MSDEKTLEEKYEEVLERNKRLVRVAEIAHAETRMYANACEKLEPGTHGPLSRLTDKSFLFILLSVFTFCSTFIISLVIFTFWTLRILING